MKKYLIGLLALVAAAAFADGVAFITMPAPTLSSAEQTTLSNIIADVGAANVTTVGLNPSALTSTIINATIAGTTYRFVGSLALEDDGTYVWTGSVNSTITVRLMSRTTPSAAGRFVIGDKIYRLSTLGPTSGVLIDQRAADRRLNFSGPSSDKAN